MKRIKAWRGGTEIDEQVAEEKDLMVTVNGTLMAHIKLSSGLQKECVVGFLAGEGLIHDLDEVEEIRITEYEAHVKTTTDIKERCDKFLSSDCIGGWRAGIEMDDIKVASGFAVDAQEIFENMKRLQAGSRLWKDTGGVHSSVLVCGDDFKIVEDISRHVTIDKIIGRGILKGLDLTRSYILTSGRLPGDMVIKAARVHIPIVASRTAPIYSGIQVAKDTGLTLCGFVRANKMNIYAHPERVRF